MITHENYEIDSTDDIELGIKRGSKLEFIVTYDGAKPAKALFVFINGIRNADYAGYEQHLAEFVASTYEVAVLRVDYHCIGFRPQTGASFYMDARDKENYAKCCRWLGEACGLKIELPAELLNDEILGQKEGLAAFGALDELLASLKNQGKIAPDFRVPLSAGLAPTKGEYNNFGVMQALDILNAICFVRVRHAKFKLPKAPKTLLFGTSHGGYLAFLCAKFAPWLVDAVVENSGYTIVPLELCGLGKQSDFVKFYEAKDNSAFEHITTYFFTKTHFSIDENSPNFFCAGRLAIRNPLNEKQLQTQAQHHKPLFVSYHSAFDNLDKAEHKEKLFELLRGLGYEARLRVVRDESEIDGKFIKDLTHGMGMSLKTLIQKELPPLLERNFQHAKGEKREIIYESEGWIYHFKQRNDGVELRVGGMKG